MDVILVLDASGSVKTQGWNAGKEVAKQVIENDVFAADTHVGVVVFRGETDVTLEIALTDLYPNRASLLTQVDGLVQPPSGKTATIQALLLAVAHFEASLDNSENRDNIIILVTDGKPRPFRRAQPCKKRLDRALKTNDIDVFAVFVGAFQTATITCIGNGIEDDEYVTVIGEFSPDKISDALWKLRSHFCPPPRCEDAAIDAMFLLDASGSVKNGGWTFEKELLMDLIKDNSFAEGSQLAVIVFRGDDALGTFVAIDWTDIFGNERKLVRKINRLRRPSSGKTSTRTALELAISYWENSPPPNDGDRLNRLFLITDGRPTPPRRQDPCVTAVDNGLAANNIDVFAALIGDFAETQIVCIGDGLTANEWVRVDGFNQRKWKRLRPF